MTNTQTQKKSPAHLMRWLGCLVVLLGLWTTNANAQVSAYTFSQSSSAYTVLTGTGTPAQGWGTTTWDDNTVTFTLPFTFTYNGVACTQVLGSANGWACLGNSIVYGSQNGYGDYLNNAGCNNNGVAAFNQDLQNSAYPTVTGSRTSGSTSITGVSSTTNLRVGMAISATGITAGTIITNIAGTTLTISQAATTTSSTAITPRGSITGWSTGVAPNRSIVLQWVRAKFYTATNTTNGDDLNFQIWINEAGGNPANQTVQVKYGTCTITTSSWLTQVGLRGSSTADVNSRTTTTDWNATTAGTNLSTCTESTTVFPASGAIFTWTPPAPVTPPNCAISQLPANGSTGVCKNPTITWADGGGIPSGYKMTFGSNSPNYDNILSSSNLGNVTSYTPPTLLTNTTYGYKIVPYNVNGDAVGCSANTFTTGTGLCYCTPNTTGGGLTYYVTNLTTTGGTTNINNTSAGSSTGYQDFSGITSMSAAANTVINYTMAIAGGSTYGRAIWIDYNQDGTFAAGEQVVSSAAYVSSPLTGSFTVSPTATVGTTRMRIVATFVPNNPSNPCANTGGAGEYEDYAFTVLPPPPPVISNFTPASACSSAPVVITGTNFTGATAVTFGGTNAQSFIVNSSTQITAIVSTSGSSGVISVTTPNGSGSSGSSFTFNGIGPVVSIQEGNSLTICSNQSQTLTALPTGGGETYLWSPNAASATSQSVSVSAAGTYTVTVTSPNTCANTTSAVLTVIPVPAGVTATPSANPVCSGAPFNLTATGTTTGSATILSEGFESGAPGWAFIDSSSTGVNIPSQVWHIQAAPYNDQTGSIFFTNFAVTGSGFAFSNPDAGGSSSSQTRTFMNSPSFSTVGYTGAGTLGFKMCFKFWGSSAPAEQVMVQISIDGGTTWAATLANYSPTNTGPDIGTTTNNTEVAVPITVNIPAIYMGQPNVKLRWRYVSNWGYVWIVDDISLTATPLPTFSWTSTPAGFTSNVQNPTGVTQTADRSYTVVATGQGGCTASASTAIVTTNTAPVIGACPGDITQCDNHVATWTDPTATGTPTPTVVCSPLSGSTFAAGTTLVTCTATNSCSPSSSCSFNVTINETPVIVCPSNINDNTTNPAGKTETYTAPSGGTPSATATCTPPSGSNFPVGTTTVNCSATNSCGTGTCSFDVIITFICTPPSISACPSDITQCDNHVATWTDPTATGGIPTPTVTCVPASGSTFATGTHLVICTASNGCAPDASCFFIVTINESPVIAACPGNITQCDNHVATWTDPTATGTPSPTVVCSPLSGSTFATGTTLVTCTATNSCGTDDCSFNVTINESATAPTSVTTDDGDNEICTSGTITLTANGGTLGSPAGTYTWYEGGCGTGSIIGTGTTLVRGPGLSVGTHVYYVRINQAACGNTTCASVSVVVTGAPPATNVPFPTVPAYACSGNNLPASTSPVTYATTYTWDGPVGTTFNSVSNPYASGSTSVTVNYGAPNGSGYNICVQGSNACGTTTRRCSFVRGTVNVPGTITPVNARTIECPSTSASYNIAAVTGATSYTWSITGNASVIGTGTSATVNFGAGWTSGTLSVTANTPCYSSAPRSLGLSNVSALPGAISGPASVCPGGPAQVYSVPAVAGAATYNWVLPANATGGSSTNSISVTFLTGYTFGDIKVSITSICGNTSAQQAKTVTTGIPGVPASVSGNATGLCGQTVVFSCPSVSGASSYTWTTCGTINSGQGSTSINATFGTFTSCNVCVTANNACGSSAPRCIPVQAKPVITGNITYTPGTICANQSGVDFQVNPVFGTSGYNWIFPAGVSVVLDLGNEQIVNWGTNSGVVSVTAANACGNSTKTTTITLTCREAATETIETNSSVSVYPNPAHDRINVQINATEKTNYVLNLMDLSGRVMSTANATAQKGMNTSELDLSTLAKGVYMIEVKSDLINKQIRVVVE